MEFSGYVSFMFENRVCRWAFADELLMNDELLVLIVIFDTFKTGNFLIQ